MERELFGRVISQKSKSEFFSATDLVNAGNKWRMEKDMSQFNLAQWLKKEGTLIFIEAMEKEFGQVIIKGKGRNSVTWVHPYIFIDLALAINPELKIQVYSWIYDFLIKYRNDSGDSYKRMVGAVYCKFANKSAFPRYIQDYASKIKSSIGVIDWNKATEKQLEQRNKIQDLCSVLVNVMTDTDKALSVALHEVLGENQ